MEKKSLQVLLDTKVLQALENLSGSAGMDRNEYVKAILTNFSRLRRERALDAIACIPKDYFKAPVGRPQDKDEN